jgi:hypothetical protein
MEVNEVLESHHGCEVFMFLESFSFGFTVLQYLKWRQSIEEIFCMTRSKTD